MKFETIKFNSHFNKNEIMLYHSYENFDSLHKCRTPVVDHLNIGFNFFKPKLAVDEQICDTKIQSNKTPQMGL